MGPKCNSGSALIAAYGLGLLFSLKTHRELFASAEYSEAGEAPWPIGLVLATLAGVTLLVALVGGAAEMASAFRPRAKTGSI
jgi:Ca2+/H+ antiporter